MENKIVRGKTLNYWKVNAEEDYFKVPISVLKYITILEEELKQSSITAVGCQREQFYCGVLKRNEGDRCYNQCGGCADKEARNKQ